MPAIGVVFAKALLDWSLPAAASPTRPAGMFAGLSIGVPISNASSEMAVASGYTRQTLGIPAASTIAAGTATATNATAATFGPFSGVGTISGAFLADSVSSAAGQYLYYGSLLTARTVQQNDLLVIASAALTITLT